MRAVQGSITLPHLQETCQWEDGDEEQRMSLMQHLLGQPLPPLPVNSGWSPDDWVFVCLRAAISHW